MYLRGKLCWKTLQLYIVRKWFTTFYSLKALNETNHSMLNLKIILYKNLYLQKHNMRMTSFCSVLEVFIYNFILWDFVDGVFCTPVPNWIYTVRYFSLGCISLSIPEEQKHRPNSLVYQNLEWGERLTI